MQQLEERIAELESTQAELEAEQQQVVGLFEQFKNGNISRRAFLGSVAAIGGIGLAAGNATAAPNYGSATGQTGTESSPLNKVISKQGTFQTVSTGEIGVSNETLVKATMSSDQSYSSGSGWVTANFDNEVKDRRGGEYDPSTQTFTPDKTGDYFISVRIGFTSSNDGDQVGVRFSGDVKISHTENVGGTAINVMTAQDIRELSGGTGYTPEFRNFDSGDSADSRLRFTTFVVKRIY